MSYILLIAFALMMKKKDIEKEHRKIWKDKCDGEWEYAFERECKRRKILLKNVSNIVIYDY